MKYILIFSLGFFIGCFLSVPKERVIFIETPQYYKYVKDGVTVQAAEAQGKTIIYQNI